MPDGNGSFFYIFPILGIMLANFLNISKGDVVSFVGGGGKTSLMISLARELAPDGLTLFTHQRNNRARTFYERRGFRAVASGISPPPESEPDVKYAWDPREDA